MTALVIAEIQNGSIAPSTLRVISAAKRLNMPIHLLLAGSDLQQLAIQAADYAGIEIVKAADSPVLEAQLAEEMAPLIAEQAHHYSHVLMVSSTTGKDILPRAAALAGVGMVSDVTNILAPDRFERPVYAGNAVETVISKAQVTFLTVRPTAFDAVEGGNKAEVELLNWQHHSGLSQFTALKRNETSRPELSSAEIVVSGGRGLQSRENFKLLEQLADKLGAAIGASRAAVDAGFIANDCQVGQTGKVVAPRLYIAVGISGAVQHLAGMKDSSVIVAINKDPDAPIFEIADYGLVGDLFELLPELIEKLP